MLLQSQRQCLFSFWMKPSLFLATSYRAFCQQENRRAIVLPQSHWEVQSALNRDKLCNTSEERPQELINSDRRHEAPVESPSSQADMITSDLVHASSMKRRRQTSRRQRNIVLDVLWTLAKNIPNLRLKQQWVARIVAFAKNEQQESTPKKLLVEFFKEHKKSVEVDQLCAVFDSTTEHEGLSTSLLELAGLSSSSIESMASNVSRYCLHGKTRRKCRDCGGSDYCEHDRFRMQCRDCCPGSFCDHGNRRNMCRQCCAGGFICGHARERNKCEECNALNLCRHGRVKHVCRPCRALEGDTDTSLTKQGEASRSKSLPTSSSRRRGGLGNDKHSPNNTKCVHGQPTTSCIRCGNVPKTVRLFPLQQREEGETLLMIVEET